MTVNTFAIREYLSPQKNNFYYIPIPGNSELQIKLIPSMDQLYRCQNCHCGAFIKDRGILVLWEEHPKQLVQLALGIEELLIRKIWNGEYLEPVDQSASPSVSNS